MARLKDGFFVGSYRVVRFLDRTPVGERYVARSSRLHRECLLVRISPDVVADPDALALLAETVAAAAALDHPAIVRTIELVQEGDVVAVATDMVPGPDGVPCSLADECRRHGGTLSDDRVEAVVRRLCSALSYAHAFQGRGIVHGNLTADAVAIDSHGRARLAGFAFAALTTASTPTAADDLAALGTLIHRTLTGDEYDGSAVPSQAGAPKRWDGIVRGCVDGSVASPQDVLEKLETTPARSGPGRLVAVLGVALGVVILAGVTVIMWPRSRREVPPTDRREPAATVAAVPQDRVEAFLDAAREALAEERYEVAEKAVAKVLEAVPANVAAQQLMADIRMRRGLAQTGPVKAAAEEAYAELRGAAEALGAADQVDTIGETMAQAQRLFAEMQFAEAAAAYRDVSDACSRALDRRTERSAAEAARDRAELARQKADVGRAQYRFPDQWRLAAECWEQAASAFAQADFAGARATWDRARTQFEELAARSAKQRIAAADTEAPEPAPEGAAAEPLRLQLPPRPNAGNLVHNGDFEQGRDGKPVGWSGVDGLTCLWEPRGNPGHCLRFDPTVLQVDKAAFQADPQAFAGRSQGGQYTTVGAHEGVWAFAPPVQVLAGDRYFVVEADVRGPRSTSIFYPQVLVRGYQPFDPSRDRGHLSFFQRPHADGPEYSEQFGKEQRPARRGDYLMVFRHGLVCRLEGPEKWQHYRLAFALPEESRFRPEILLLKAYAMWPLGDYFFDNISLRSVTADEYETVKRVGHSADGFLPVE